MSRLQIRIATQSLYRLFGVMIAPHRHHPETGTPPTAKDYCWCTAASYSCLSRPNVEIAIMYKFGALTFRFPTPTSRSNVRDGGSCEWPICKENHLLSSCGFCLRMNLSFPWDGRPDIDDTNRGIVLMLLFPLWPLNNLNITSSNSHCYVHAY